MVRYSNYQMKRNNIGDACNLIHEGKLPDLMCLLLAKNQLDIFLDDGKLDEGKSSYLILLRDGLFSTHHDTTFYVEHYNP